MRPIKIGAGNEGAPTLVVIVAQIFEQEARSFDYILYDLFILSTVNWTGETFIVVARRVGESTGGPLSNSNVQRVEALFIMGFTVNCASTGILVVYGS